MEPVNVRIILENGGRPSGEADVEFATHEEAVKAMSKVCSLGSFLIVSFNSWWLNCIYNYCVAGQEPHVP